MLDPGIVRNRAKIEATVALARIYLDLAERGGFANHLWSFVGGRPIQPGAQEPRRHSRRERGVARHRQGPARPRRQFRRADDRLRLHAGDRHGQRPSRRLLPPRGLPGAGPRSSAMSDRGARRAWQRMLSGRRLDLIDPSPVDVEIADIAHGLARVARWNGQTLGPEIFSVAQHSLLVEALFAAGAPEPTAGMRLAALLHDAPEYVIGDMISPFKAAIGGDYRRVEARLHAGDPHPLRAARGARPRARQAHQGGRPRLGLYGGDGAGGLRRRRGATICSASRTWRSAASPPISSRCGRPTSRRAFSPASANSTPRRRGRKRYAFLRIA